MLPAAALACKDKLIGGVCCALSDVFVAEVWVIAALCLSWQVCAWPALGAAAIEPLAHQLCRPKKARRHVD